MRRRSARRPDLTARRPARDRCALNSYKNNVQEHYLNVYSFSGALVTLEEGTAGSWSGTLGVIAQASGGGLSLSGTSTHSWSADVSQSGVADSTVSNRVNYRQQTVSCVGGSTWWQYSLYDMLTDFSYSGHVNYATCSPRSAGTAWATSTAKNTTWSAGVSFPGIGASAQSGYGTSQQMTYHFTSSGSICGNSTSGPLSSSQVSAHA